MVRAIVFDFGGVISDEGFRNGLTAIARQNGFDPEVFFEKSKEMIYPKSTTTSRCSTLTALKTRLQTKST
jgi:putative hydrolase of the HAD superfamily